MYFNTQITVNDYICFVNEVVQDTTSSLLLPSNVCLGMVLESRYYDQSSEWEVKEWT